MRFIRVKNIKNAILLALIIIFLIWSVHFVLSAGFSIVDKNGCLRPAYTCKSDKYLENGYNSFVAQQLQNNPTCQQKQQNYLQPNTKLWPYKCSQATFQ
ncbi:hypothetical protein ABPG74_003232 [Tetrahymena malaccensis]